MPSTPPDIGQPAAYPNALYPGQVSPSQGFDPARYIELLNLAHAASAPVADSRFRSDYGLVFRPVAPQFDE